LNTVDLDELYEQSFEESTVMIGGYQYDEYRAQREVDPTAYRCGLNDYIDSLVTDGVLTDEIGGNHYDAKEVAELLESQDG
jgi:hypothetical protein